MTAEIINLRRRRKKAELAAKENLAEANRRGHGRTSAQKLQDKMVRENAASTLDQHRLARKPEPPL